MSTFPRTLALAALLPLAGCGTPFGTCISENVIASFPATVTSGGTAQPAEFAGRVNEGNLDPSTFRLVRRLTRDAGSEDTVLVFTLEGRAETQVAFVALAVRTPLREGEVLPVAGAFQGGGWGTGSLPAGEDVRASIRLGSAYAGTVSGTVEVLDASPLRLRLDLQAGEARETTLGIRGDVTFRHQDDRVSCS